MKIRQDIEILRFLSAFGIVMFHAKTKGACVGYSGLIFFVVLSVFLTGRFVSIKKRARRLLVPWVICSIFYGVLNLIIQKPFISLNNGLVAGILFGTQYHLWYLPFVFVVLVVIDAIKTKLPKFVVSYIGGVLAVIALMSSWFWRGPSIELGYPWAQYAHAIPGVFVGMFFYGFGATDKKYGILLLILLLLGTLVSIPLSGVGLPYLIVVVLFSVILFYPVTLSEHFNITKISSLSFGIYLIHPLFLTIINYSNIHIGIVLPIVVFFNSALSVWIVKEKIFKEDECLISKINRFGKR